MSEPKRRIRGLRRFEIWQFGRRASLLRQVVSGGGPRTWSQFWRWRREPSEMPAHSHGQGMRRLLTVLKQPTPTKGRFALRSAPSRRLRQRRLSDVGSFPTRRATK